MKAIKSNSVEKVVAKKKSISKATLKAMAKKRKLNPQFAIVQSNRRKAQNLEVRTSLINTLIEVKKDTNIKIDLTSVENKVYLKECKVLINYIIKNRNEFLPLLMPLVRVTKKGHFVKFYTEQAIQKVVKLKMSKDMDYLTAFNGLNAKKLIEA
jgi:hypothetical protein